jgi:hypothetical protein
MKRLSIGSDAYRPDRGPRASRRGTSDSDGGETQPDAQPGAAPAPEADGEHAERRASIGLGDALMPLESLSTEQLKRELDRRQGELKRLVTRRSRLAEQLAELEAQIRSMGGENGPVHSEPRHHAQPRAPRVRSKNEITLSDAMAMAVEVRATVTPTEVAQLVQANGYRSTSKNFAMMVANALAKDKRFRRLSRGQYERIA